MGIIEIVSFPDSTPRVLKLSTTAGQSSWNASYVAAHANTDEGCVMIAQMMDDDPRPVMTLRDRLQACRKEGLPGIPVTELLGYVQQIALALDARHSRYSLHGNVNPGTIFIENGRARLAQPVAADVSADPNMILGTPTYLSPETLRGQRGPASDQYALAASYVELRRGRPPFLGQDLVSLLREHLEMNPDLAGLTDGESKILQAALAKDPRRRHATCARLVEALMHATATGQ
jgi:serine/threonine protein kinase